MKAHDIPCHGPFLIRSKYIEQLENEMRKNTSPNKSSKITQPPVATSATTEIALAPFWLLNAGTAKKLGQRSTGILNYHVIADNDRLRPLLYN